MPTVFWRALQMLNLDSDSNIWVAGGPGLTKVFSDPAAITKNANLTATPASPVVMLSNPAHASIDLSLVGAPGYAAACTDASCCTTGSWDAGIAVSRDATNTIYVANTCTTGLVREKDVPQVDHVCGYP